MDKIRSILAANRKMGPPVPPRPSPAAMAQALQQKRQISPDKQFQQQHDGRTVIYKSPSFSSTPKKQQQNDCEFLVERNDENESSTGNVSGDNCLEAKLVEKDRNGNLVVGVEKPVTLPRKSPVALPRSKTPSPPVLKDSSPAPLTLIVQDSPGSNLPTKNNGNLVGFNPPPSFKPPSLPQQTTKSSIKYKSSPSPAKERAPPPPPPQSAKLSTDSQQSPSSPQTIIINGSELNNFQTNLNKKSVKCMNEFIKNNIYYRDEQQQQSEANERTKDVENGNYLNNNSYPDQSSSNSSTLSYSSSSTAHEPSDYQNFGLNFEMANNRRNLGSQKNGNDTRFKEKLFTEIFIKSGSADDAKLNNSYVNYGKLTKRANSLDFLNVERPEPEGASDVGKPKTLEDKISAKKVEFHEILISELAEMRKTPDCDERTLLSRKFARSSPDISPDGTGKSRIRNSDIIDVDGNGKKVYSSCYISLEDSGLEDEEKLDDCSSGVGDSWDSCKDAEER